MNANDNRVDPCYRASEYDNRVDPCYRASEFTTDLNNIDIPLEVARSDSKYYLNSHKDTPYPTLTDSQQKDFERERIKLNNILHTGEITNNNISTFSDYEFADSSFVEDVLDDSPETRLSMRSEIPEIEKGCCYLI